MRNIFAVLVGILSLLVAQAALAADGPVMDSYGLGLTAFAAAMSMALAAVGCGIAQGMGLKAACEGVARNPDASGKLTVLLILGLAFIESLAIYTLVINLILLFVKPFS